MRNNGLVTAVEIPVPKQALLVSQTDKGGRITFVNDAFVEISGFQREELIGAAHNLVRHPHMPKAAFRDLWETIRSGQPWEGVIKNRTKNGDFYWVRANVTPVVEDGELKGYISIRVSPDRAEVAVAETAYAAIRDGHDRRLRVKGGAVVRAGLITYARRISRGIATSFGISLAALFAAIVANLASESLGLPSTFTTGALLAVMALVSIVTLLTMQRMRRVFRTIETQFAALARGDLKQLIDLVPVTELQSITGFLRGLRARLAYAEEVRAQIERNAAADRVAAVQEMATKVEEAANQTAEQVASTTSVMADNASIMAEAASAVSANAAIAAGAGAEALASTQTVAAAAEELAASIREIANRITVATGVTRGAVAEGESAGQTIFNLRNEVDRIGTIASLIADIAGQTNLLALNATIESARAGDAGRGFAVVANEVKKLAGQTAKATDEISRQIAQIQRATDETVAAVSRMGGKLGEIDDVSVAIAAAVEEQSAATQEISRSVNKAATSVQSVSDAVAGMVALASQTNDKAERLRTDAAGLAGNTDASRWSLIKAVRTSVAEAERRMHERAAV